MHCGLSWFHSMDTVKPEINAHCTSANPIADGRGATRTARRKLPQRQCFPKTVTFLLSEPARAKEDCLPHIQCSAAEEKKHFDFQCRFLLQVFDALRYEEPVRSCTVPIFQPFLKNTIKQAMCSTDWAKRSPGEALLISACV